MKQMLSISLTLNISYLKIIHIPHPRYHLKTAGRIIKNKQKSKRVFIHEITQLIVMKIKMKIKQ